MKSKLSAALVAAGCALALSIGAAKADTITTTPIGTPELVLLLVALGGMTAAAIWGVTELTNPRR